MDRKGPLVGLALIVASAVAARAAGPDVPKPTSAPPKPAPAKGATKGAPAARKEPLERRPYKIRAWVAIDPRARLDARGREQFVAGWRTLVRRFVGTPWDLEIAAGDGPLADDSLASVKPQAIAPLVEDCDKAWLLTAAPQGAGYLLSGREFDVATKLLGPIVHRPAPFPGDTAREMLNLSLNVFCPSAEIGETSGGGVLLTVQGGALEPADPIGKVVGPNTVFRAIRLYLKPDGSILKLDPIRSTYLRADVLEGSTARCMIISAYGDPLSRRVVQRNRLLALGIRPSAVPTRLRFVIAAQEKPPAAGYTLKYRSTLPNAPEHEIGTTDRDGRVVLPPNFAEGLVILRLLAADVEPLVEFPLMPGETDEERTIVLHDTKPKAVAFQTELNSLRDEIVDLVARRARIEAKVKARADGEAWDDVKALLDEYHRLPLRSALAERLGRIEGEARRQQNARMPILTKASQVLLTDTKALMDRYLDDETIKPFEEALEAQSAPKKDQAAPKKDQGTPKALAKAEAPAPGAKKAEAPTPPPAAEAKKAAPGANEGSIEGSWRLVAQEVDGQRYPTQGTTDDMPVHIFQDGKFTYKLRETVTGSGSYRLNTGKTPKWIEFIPEGQTKGAPGIYDVQGDRLTVCVTAPGSPRPTTFQTKPKSGFQIFSYERVAAAAAAVAGAESATKPSPAPAGPPGIKPVGEGGGAPPLNSAAPGGGMPKPQPPKLPAGGTPF